ncbi:DNA polymerase III subunit alpha, partial [Gammaproteobacteria bacterium]|nr:DNA polymerase III subunit alpha [Gammaproteobacteria bacterium]
KTLTIIDWAVKAINKGRIKEGLPEVDISNIDLNDERSFDLLKSAKTIGIFQLESRGMRDLITRLVPESLNDIIALVALFRPGPLQSGAADDFVNRKHRLAAVEYPHPSLKTVLQDTFGVVLYQEQVMQIAQELAGFSLGQADLLRRAMGKKKPEEMAKVREQFREGATANEIPEKLAGEIFDLMEKFAGYAFNKSHSATYALISYQTAWLKAHYPAEFMAANLSAEMQNIDRVVVLANEVNDLGLNLRPPSINQSSYRFEAIGKDVIYGLGALRGVGETAVESMQSERDSSGDYQDLVDFCQRLGSKKINKRVVEALIMAGAMDCLFDRRSDINKSRGLLLAGVPQAIQGAEQNLRDEQAGIVDLFGDVAVTNKQQIDSIEKPISNKERLSGEKEVLGLFLTGHPIDDYESELSNFCSGPIVDLKAGRKNQILAGTIVNVRVAKGRGGNKMCFLVIDDKSCRIEVSVFSDRYEKYSKLLFKDHLIVIEGELSNNDYAEGLSVRAEKIWDINGARALFSNSLCLDFSRELLPENFNIRLKKLISPYVNAHKGSRVSIKCSHGEAEAVLSLGEAWMVDPSDDLLGSLRQEFGDGRVMMDYA